MSDPLQRLERAARRRSDLSRTARALAIGLTVSAPIALGAALVHRFVAAVPLSLGATCVLLPVAIMLHTSVRSRPAPHALTAAIDRAFGTHSLVTSALGARGDSAAARIVRADAAARAETMRAGIARVFPVIWPRGSGASLTALLAAAFLLAGPGAPVAERAASATDAEARGSPPVAGTGQRPPARDARARDYESSARLTRDVGAHDDEGDGTKIAGSESAGTTSAVAGHATSDAGGAPGDAAGVRGDAARETNALEMRWTERARTGSSRATTASDVGDEPAAEAGTDEAGPAPALPPAAPGASTYEPVFPPALAAYVRAANANAPEPAARERGTLP